MFTSHTDAHQDAVTLMATGVKELVEKKGHHDNLHFTSFEVVAVQGTIDSSGAGQGGGVGRYQVILRAFGAHRHSDHA